MALLTRTWNIATEEVALRLVKDVSKAVYEDFSILLWLTNLFL